MDRIERQRKRLSMLISEFGTQERLAAKIGTAESYISQLLTSRKGIARKFCERLERATGKPNGWMDQWLPEESEVLGHQPLTDTEYRILCMWRTWSPPIKAYVFGQMKVANWTKDELEKNIVTEADIDKMVSETVSQTGEFKTLDPATISNE